MWSIFFGHGSKTLGDVLTRGSNNFDLLRLLAATAVIYGHAFALHGNPVGSDILHRFTGLHAAEWGVKTFFFLSGLLVVNSVLSDGNALHYAIKRILRIWPALILVTLVSVFVMGPALSTVSMSVYFDSSEPWDFLRRMVTFRIWGNNSMGLPGVFETNPYPLVVNAPLWTLSVEAYAYILIYALFLIGAFKKESAVLVFGLFLIDSLLPQKVIFYWLPSNSPDFAAIPFCFALGGLLAVFKDNIRINIPLIIGVILLSDLLGGGPHASYLRYTVMFLLVIYVFSMSLATRLPRLPDISYGTYLWGWPVQQIVLHLYPGVSFGLNLLLTLALVYAAAVASWYLVELRCLKFGQSIVRRNKARLAAKVHTPAAL